MAAKLRLDEFYINSKGHPMDVDGVNGQEEQEYEVKPAPQQQANHGYNQQQPIDANTIWLGLNGVS